MEHGCLLAPLHSFSKKTGKIGWEMTLIFRPFAGLSGYMQFTQRDRIPDTKRAERPTVSRFSIGTYTKGGMLGPEEYEEKKGRDSMWPFDQNNQQAYQQYAQAYESGNYNGIDPNQAFGHVQQFVQNAPPDVQQRVYTQHFEQWPVEQRQALVQQLPSEYGMDPNNPASMAQGFTRLGRERPDLWERVFKHPVLIGMFAGLIAKHMLNEHAREEQRARGW